MRSLTKTEQQEQGLTMSLENSVIHYAKMTQAAGLDGVVCSALEAPMIKKQTNNEFICLTPGIRPLGTSLGDQQRVVTPKGARELGANFIVVGRPITQSSNPYPIYQAIKKEWSGE